MLNCGGIAVVIPQLPVLLRLSLLMLKMQTFDAEYTYTQRNAFINLLISLCYRLSSSLYIPQGNSKNNEEAYPLPGGIILNRFSFLTLQLMDK